MIADFADPIVLSLACGVLLATLVDRINWRRSWRQPRALATPHDGADAIGAKILCTNTLGVCTVLMPDGETREISEEMLADIPARKEFSQRLRKVR